MSYKWLNGAATVLTSAVLYLRACSFWPATRIGLLATWAAASLLASCTAGLRSWPAAELGRLGR